jgi:hypothetical protein
MWANLAEELLLAFEAVRVHSMQLNVAAAVVVLVEIAAVVVVFGIGQVPQIVDDS